jgi:hypothetical protein
MPFNHVRLNDLSDVTFRDITVPNTLWIDHYHRTVFALIKASSLIHANHRGQPLGFALEGAQQRFLLFRVATASRVTILPRICAYEDVEIK